MADIKQINVSGTNYNIYDNSAVHWGGTVQTTNPFGGSPLYINSIDNAFHSATNRFYITATIHSVSYNGSTYPKTDTSKAVTADDYVVDSPIESTIDASNIFDGNYESNLRVNADKYLRIRVMFGANTSPSGTSAIQSGYPYGDFYLSYYYVCKPARHSLYRVYNKYEGHGLGWKIYEGYDRTGTLSGRSANYIEQITDNGNYSRTCMDFIIFGSSDNEYGYTGPTELEWHKSRPSLSYDGATVTKYGSNTLYSPLYFNSNHSTLVSIYPSGDIYANNFYGLASQATSAVSSSKVSGTSISGQSALDELVTGDGTLKYNVFTGVESVGFGSNDGLVLTASWLNNNAYGYQIAIDNTSNATMKVRAKSTNWSNWKTVITSDNIGSQSVNYSNSAGSATQVQNKNVEFKNLIITDSGTTTTYKILCETT